jgi:hypothetical protein
MAEIDDQRVYQDNPAKGSKGKNPWIEIHGQRMGHSALIIEHLCQRHATGLGAPFVFSSIEAPVIQYANRRPNLQSYCKRLFGELFQEWSDDSAR